MAYAITGEAPEIEQAMVACEMPLVVWQGPTGLIRLVNGPALALFERSSEELLGHELTEFLLPRRAATTAVGALESGAVNAIRSVRTVPKANGEKVHVWVWSRAAQVGPVHCAISVLMPVPELARAGRDPAEPWRELADVAVGFSDGQWRIEQISADIETISGHRPADLLGTSLGELLGDQVAAGSSEPPPSHGQIQHLDGTLVPATLLFAEISNQPKRIAFALCGELQDPADLGRVASLELRLRRIGAEVRAAGVLDELQGLPAIHDLPELRELSSRQWDILSRLVRGERVPTIASTLYLSQSTVRNHLSVIFRKFGVHSQAELMQALSQARGPDGGAQR